MNIYIYIFLYNFGEFTFLTKSMRIKNVKNVAKYHAVFSSLTCNVYKII